MTFLILLKAIFGRIVGFVSDNWRWVVPLVAAIVLFWYVHHLQAQRDDAINNLASFKQQIATQAEAQKQENLRKEAAAQLQQKSINDAHQAQINQLRKDYDAKHQNEKTAADSTIGLWRDRVRLEVARNINAASSLPEATSEPAKDGGNGYATVIRNAYDTLETACAVTTSDYNALWESWNKACSIYGCK